MKRYASVSAAAIFALAGCSLGPDFLKPRVDVPGSFTAAAETAGAAWPAQGWWANFRSPELDGLINRAGSIIMT